MEQKKKVQIRFQTCSNPIRNVNHDLRITKPDYLTDDMYHNQFENMYFDFNHKQVKKQMQKSHLDYNEKYKRRVGRNLQKGRQSDLLTGVITLSPIVNQWLENKKISKEELDKCFTNSIPKIKDKIKEILNQEIETFSYVIHYDEKTPHLHFSFSNHTDIGESIFHKIKLSGRLNEFQDVVASEFLEVGLERGDRKSKAKHLSVRRMHEEEIKTLKQDIKNIQKQKKEIKSNLDKSTEQKKEELDKLDVEIRLYRQEIKDLSNDVKAHKDKKIQDSKYLKQRIKNTTQEILDSSDSKDELQEKLTDLIEYHAETNFLSNKELLLEMEKESAEITIHSLETQKRDLTNKVMQLEEKIDSRTIMEEIDITEIEEEAENLLNEIKLAQKRDLESIRKESIVNKKSMFGKKEELDVDTFIKKAKKREEFLLFKIHSQSNLINRLILVLKKIANFYKKVFSPFMKNEKNQKKLSKDTKNEIDDFLHKPIFSNNKLILSQLDIKAGSLIEDENSKYFNMHQFKLKIEFIDSSNINKRMQNIKKNLNQFEKVLNVSFSQDEADENIYYLNLISRERIYLEDVISDLKYNDIESIFSGNISINKNDNFDNIIKQK